MLTSRTDEAIIKTISGLESLYGDAINLPKNKKGNAGLYLAIMKSTEKSTALTVLDDMPENLFVCI